MAGTMRVAVIGGGIVGCAAAAFLAERGATVVLFEQTALGAGASGRNLGSVQHPYDPLLEPLHLETIDLYRELAAALDAFAFPDEPASVLLVATDGDELRRHAERLAAALPVLDPAYLDAAAARRLEPALAPDVGAIRLATGYPVRPEAAVEGYAELARGRGVEFRLGISTRPWVEGERARGVRLADGTRLEADAVLVAAGPWTPETVDDGGGWNPIGRTWGVTLTLELPDPPRHVLEEEEIGEVELGGDFRWQVPAEERAVFSLATADGYSALGSTFFPREPDPARLEPALLDRGQRFVPSIAHARIVQRRMCARPQSADGRPFIGSFPGVEGLYVCAGHGPWGISTGPASARLVADAVIQGGDHPIPPDLRVSRVMGS